MFDRLLQRLKADPRPHDDPAARERLAAAVLLFEMARADYDHQPSEHAALRDGLIRDFGVPEATVDALLAQAEQRARNSVSLYEFVTALNATMDFGKKRELLRLMWKVAYADGRIDPHEEHLLRKIADLLGLSHADFIRGKLANNN